MKEYLIGEKLSHSYSAYIHSLFGGKDYGLKPLAREELAPFLRRKEFDGLNVTIPYKKEVIPFLDGISPLAARIGAVNTVVNRNGRLFGDNTDYFGLDFLARSAGVDFKGKNVLILGTGGTSETAATLARDCGAVRVERVSRTGELDYQNVYARRDTEVIVNATPVGMFPNNGARALDLSRFPRLSGALDAIYNPLRTEFVLQAKALGAACAGGLFMLVAQGARARELFDGRKRSDGEILAACEKAERRYGNSCSSACRDRENR
ncbi:MAG: shikimate dehydrogenase family protein [Eubacteriales bacterium]